MAPIAFVADIEQAFHQIKLESEDSNAIIYLWIRQDDSDDKIVAFKFKCVPFCLVCSPFMLQAVIRKLLDDCGEEFPEAVNLIVKQLYVDDLLGHAKTMEQAKELVGAIRTIFSRAGMSMRKWMTNDATLRERFGELDISGVSEGNVSRAIDGTTKTLGMSGTLLPIASTFSQTT